MRFSEWLHVRIARTDSIALTRLMELLFEYLREQTNLDAEHLAELMCRDYARGGRHDRPAFLKPFLPSQTTRPESHSNQRYLPKRQARHALKASPN